jgi:hypothetical protein
VKPGDFVAPYFDYVRQDKPFAAHFAEQLHLRGYRQSIRIILFLQPRKQRVFRVPQFLEILKMVLERQDCVVGQAVS